MVVVDQGKRAIGRTIEVTVTSVLQTTAGKMIFCQWPEALSAPAEAEGRREPRGSERRDARNGREFRGEHRREVDRPPAAAPATEVSRGADPGSESQPPAPSGGSTTRAE